MFCLYAKEKYSNSVIFVVVPLGSLLRRREYNVEIEYFHKSKNIPPKRSRLFGKQISLPNGFLSSSIKKKAKVQRTWSTSEVITDTLEGNTECLVILFMFFLCRREIGFFLFSIFTLFILCIFVS